MSSKRRDVAVSKDGANWLQIAMALLAMAMLSLLAVTPAQGSMGYEPDTPNSVLVAGIEFPHGVAVDQVSHRVYVAVVSYDSINHVPGEIRRFESDGTPAGTFGAGPQTFFSGVAVNPVTQGFYGSQVQAETPLGNFGTAQMDTFSSTGVLGTSFPLSAKGTLPQIATDSAGDVYLPNSTTHSVQVFNAGGVLQEEISCSGCLGGAFGTPVSVAIDSDDNLYVADLSPDRVVKLTLSGGSYGFGSLLQSGRGAAAVGVDPSTDDVFVGDYPNGTHYHVVAYDSSGTQFDDFGAGMFIDPPLGAAAVAQIAADATSHKLYLTETDKIYVFRRVAISAPSATIGSATAIGQITATLNASVNANGHAVIECDFEYVDEADFQSDGFADATSLPCPKLPDGSTSTALGAQVAVLSPDTPYRYRVTAKSNAGSTTSGDKTFKTLPASPPTVTTESPLAVTQVAAMIRGTVNPHGGTVSDCHFELGTSMSYGSSIPCSKLPGPVATDVAASSSASGLTHSTTYHYRLVVGTNAGVTEGDDAEFKTASPPAGPESGTPPPATATVPPPLVPSTGPIPPSHPLRCRKGFVKKRIRGKVKCVKRKRANRRRHHPRR